MIISTLFLNIMYVLYILYVLEFSINIHEHPEFNHDIKEVKRKKMN